MILDITAFYGQPRTLIDWCVDRIPDDLVDDFKDSIPKDQRCRYRYLRASKLGEKVTIWLSNGAYDIISKNRDLKDSGIAKQLTNDKLNGFKNYRICEDGTHDDGTLNEFFHDHLINRKDIINPLKINTMKSLLPLTDLKNLEEIKYLEGRPRVLRFDASRGTIRTKDNKTVCTPTQKLELIPLGFRLFTDQLFDYKEPMKWLELFFLNERSQVTSIMFHGYSVEEFCGIHEDLWYDGIDLSDIRLSIQFMERISKETQAKYFIADFGFSELSKVEKNKLQKAIGGATYYRSDTVTQNLPSLELALNYDNAGAKSRANSLHELPTELVES